MTFDEIVGVSPAILTELTRLSAVGVGPEALIQYLHDAGVSKPGATIALRRSKVMSLGDTKLAVHYHPAYADRRADDEAFQDAAFAAWEAVKLQESTDSAAA